MITVNATQREHQKDYIYVKTNRKTTVDKYSDEPQQQQQQQQLE